MIFKTVQIQKSIGYILPENIFVIKNGKKVKAITFTVDKNHKNYFGEKCYYKKINLISKASGFLGSCKEYLKNTAKSFEEINIKDKEILNLMKILKKNV